MERSEVRAVLRLELPLEARKQGARIKRERFDFWVAEPYIVFQKALQYLSFEHRRVIDPRDGARLSEELAVIFLAFHVIAIEVFLIFLRPIFLVAFHEEGIALFLDVRGALEMEEDVKEAGEDGAGSFRSSFGLRHGFKIGKAGEIVIRDFP